MTHSTILGQSLAVELGAGANLNLNFAAAPTTGSTFTLATDVSGFAGSVGTFTNVNATGLGAGQSATVDYGTLNAGELTVTIVPEPSSTALLGLGGLALVLRRRK